MTRVGGAIVLIVVIAAIVGPIAAPFDPSAQELALRLAGPTGLHWFGLDELGRDIFTRVLYGARISLLVGIVVVSVYSTVGIALGAIAGYFGGRVVTYAGGDLSTLFSSDSKIHDFKVGGDGDGPGVPKRLQP